MPLLCIHLITALVIANAHNCACFKRDFAGCSRAFETTCMLQNPDELHYMTTCLQRDNVKLKVVVNCARLVLVCVVMQKRKCLGCLAAFGDLTIQRKALIKPFFPLPHRIPFLSCNG